MQSLNDIFNKNSSDKGTTFGECHNYGDVYERLIVELDGIIGIDLLEIGVCDPRKHGASLVSWDEWFKDKCQYHITGLDIVDAHEFENEHISFVLADQSDRKQLSKVHSSNLQKFTHIIDDGSHIPEHQQISLGFLWPMLRNGGIYFIEDLHASAPTVAILKGFLDGTTRFDDSNMFPQEQVRLFNEIERIEWYCSDKLVAIYKK